MGNRVKAAIRAVVAAVGVFAAVGACDPCFGTSQCIGTSQISLSGRVISHKTGKVVPGTSVAFYWRPGIASLDDDSIVSVASADGSWRLSRPIPSGGKVVGRLVVTPPAPYTPYTVPNFEAATTHRFGDGVWLGDVVVDPYYWFVGEVHDRETGAIVGYCDVQMGRIAGVEASPSYTGQTAEASGRVSQEFMTKGYGPLTLEVTLTDFRYPRPYKQRVHVMPEYIEKPARNLTILLMKPALPYYLSVRRRGSPDVLPGAWVAFHRTGGIMVSEPDYIVIIPESGVAVPYMWPKEDGVLYGVFTVSPPPGFYPEAHSVSLPTLDGDSIAFLHLNYGSQVYAKARFRYRATGALVEQGVNASLLWRAGMGIDHNGVLVPLDSTGTLRYTSSTPANGPVIADLSVNLREPFDFDTVRNVTVQARQDSFPNDLGTFMVGRWFPWSGTVVDATNDAPIAGATVEFTRTDGIPVAPSPFRTTSNAAGAFPIRPVPLRGGAVQGNLSIKFGGVFRDTTITGLQLTTSKNDTVRAIPVIRARRITP